MTMALDGWPSSSRCGRRNSGRCVRVGRGADEERAESAAENGARMRLSIEVDTSHGRGDGEVEAGG